MKKRKIFLPAFLGLVITVGIALSCSKDAAKVGTDNKPAAAKNTESLESRWIKVLNEYYKNCMFAYRTDSAAFVYACSLDDSAEFYSVVSIPASLRDSLNTLTALIREHYGQQNSGGSMPSGVETDTCTSCGQSSYTQLGEDVIQIYGLAHRIHDLDPNFNEGEPLMANEIQGCAHHCLYLQIPYTDCITLCSMHDQVQLLFRYELYMESIVNN